MSLTSNNNQKGKGANKNQKSNNSQASKFISKPAKGGSFGKKPIKTGGTRGS